MNIPDSSTSPGKTEESRQKAEGSRKTFFFEPSWRSRRYRFTKPAAYFFLHSAFRFLARRL
jgi:hypothetical protein